MTEITRCAVVQPLDQTDDTAICELVFNVSLISGNTSSKCDGGDNLWKGWLVIKQHLTARYNDLRKAPTLTDVVESVFKIDEKVDEESVISDIVERPAASNVTLFCFMVINPRNKEEQRLLIAGLLVGGLASCDLLEVYTKPEITLSYFPAEVRRKLTLVNTINQSMYARIGGKTRTAMNTGIFQMVYRQIFQRATCGTALHEFGLFYW